MRFVTRARKSPSIILVSLIDILAILLIFFIVTTTFRKPQPQVVINLPESATADQPMARTQQALLAVQSAERILLDGREVPMPELAAAVAELRQTAPDRPLGVQIDREVPFQVVVSILDALKKGGVTQIPAFAQSPAKD